MTSWEEHQQLRAEEHLRAQAEDPQHDRREDPYTCPDCIFERFAPKIVPGEDTEGVPL